MTKSLALDASLTNCGYSIWQDETYQVSGQFKPQGKDWIDKIQSIARWLYMWTMKHQIDYVFYEYPSGTRNHDTTIKLGALMYAVHLFCRLRDIRFVTVKPSEAKATGLFKAFDYKKKDINSWRFSNALCYKSFDVFYHTNGEWNVAAMKRQDDEIDSLGIFKAGWEKVKNEHN